MKNKTDFFTKLKLGRGSSRTIFYYSFQFGFTKIVHKITNYNMTNTKEKTKWANTKRLQGVTIQNTSTK